MVIKQIKLWLLNLWYKVQDIYMDTPVHIDDLEEQVEKASDSWVYTEYLDPLYVTTTRDKLVNMLKYLPTKRQKYIRNEHDCEEFAFEARTIVKKIFPNLPFGYVHVTRPDGQKHAMNIIFYETKSGRLTYEFFEPQTGKMFMSLDEPYLMLL